MHDQPLEIIDYDDINSHIFVASDGRKIPTKKFSPLLLEKIRNSIEFPAVPTYVVKTISGNEEIIEHSESTLETEEDHQVWQKYLADQKEAEAQVVRKMLNLILVKGVDVQLPEDPDWMEEQELIGLTIPKDNPAKLRLHYIETEVISGSDDLTNLMTFVMERIGVRREVIEEAEKSFQDNISQETPERDDESTVRNGSDGGRRYQVIESRLEL